MTNLAAPIDDLGSSALYCRVSSPEFSVCANFDEQDKLQENSEGLAGDIFMDGSNGEGAENDYQGANQDEHWVAIKN